MFSKKQPISTKNKMDLKKLIELTKNEDIKDLHYKDKNFDVKLTYNRKVFFEEVEPKKDTHNQSYVPDPIDNFEDYENNIEKELLNGRVRQ